MHAIAVVNQKGGCGKTTTAVNLAAGLAARGRRTLLVDLDPQAHASLALGWIDDGSEKGLFDVIVDPYLPLETVIAERLPGLDLAPGNVVLHAVEQLLSGAPHRESRLQRKLLPLEPRYDVVVIDTPPAVGLLTVNALAAARLVLVTVEASFFALHGMAKLFETIEMVRRETGRDLEVRALCTMFDARTRIAQDVLEEMRRHLGDTMYSTVIRVNVKLREAASHGKPIFEYAAHSKGTEDYGALADEVLQGLGPAMRREEAAVAGEPAALDAALEGARAASGCEVPFRIYAPNASSVVVAGDWNGWSETATPLVRDASTGVWTARPRIPPGRHEYRFVVDGVWVTDPGNTAMTDAPYGERNSVIEVAGG